MIVWMVEINYIGGRQEKRYFDCAVCAVEAFQLAEEISDGLPERPVEVPRDDLPNGCTINVCAHSGVRV